MTNSIRPPFLHSKISTQSYGMYGVISLIPAVIWGIYRYDVRAILIIISALIGAVIGKFLLDRIILKRNSSIWNSLFIGMLTSCVFSPDSFVLLPGLSSLVGYFLGYSLFGLSRMTVISPVLIGYFLVFSFVPNGFTSIQIHSPLDQWYGLISQNSMTRPFDSISSYGIPEVYGANDISQLIQNTLGIQIPSQFWSLFLGFGNGSIGGSSPLMILLGSVLFLAKRVGDWRLSLSATLSFSIFTIIFGSIFISGTFFHGDALFFLINGNVLICLLFVPHILGTNPVTLLGKTIFGIVFGFLLFLSSHIGYNSQNVFLALALSQLFVPIIDVLSRSKASYLRVITRI